MASEREVTIEQFREHLAELRVERPINEIILHHTWTPTAADYCGIETVRDVRRYEMCVRGHSDNGHHVMIGPDGRIFLCRPLGSAGTKLPGHNAHTIHVAFIADLNREDPTSYPVMMKGAWLICAALLERYGLQMGAVRFAREIGRAHV